MWECFCHDDPGLGFSILQNKRLQPLWAQYFCSCAQDVMSCFKCYVMLSCRWVWMIWQMSRLGRSPVRSPLPRYAEFWTHPGKDTFYDTFPQEAIRKDMGTISPCLIVRSRKRKASQTIRVYSFSCSLLKAARTHQRARRPNAKTRNATTRPPSPKLPLCLHRWERANSGEGQINYKGICCFTFNVLPRIN